MNKGKKREINKGNKDRNEHNTGNKDRYEEREKAQKWTEEK